MISIFDEINDKESYWGEVVDIDDPKKASRIKVRVVSVYDQIEVDSIPWAFPRYLDAAEHDLPAIGDIVYVKFMNDDIYFPTWYRIRKADILLSDEDYTSAVVLKEKDLSKYDGLDGHLSVRYTQSEGLLIELKRNDNTSTVVIRNDNTVLLKNGQTNRIIHISNESISIGSETKSQQPCVVGNDNHEALKKLNNTIQTLAEIMNENLKILSKIAKSNPYTRLLSPPFTKYATQVKTQIDRLHKINDDFFPETLSTISTIDKT